MKRFVAMMIVISFLAAGCTPEMARVGALGIVAGAVGGLALASAWRDRSVAGQNAQVAQTKIAADHAENMRELEINGVTGGYRALGGIPSTASLKTSDMTEGNKTTLTWKPHVPPQNNRHSVNNGNGESSLYRAGVRAAREGVDTNESCDGSQDDYCRGYNAEKEER